MNPTLTAREREVLKQIAEGLENDEIGRELGMALGTVKSHVQRIYLKTGAINRAHAAAIAVRRGVA